MKALSTTRILALGLALLGLVNAIALAGAAWNRSGEEAHFSLSERELKQPWSWSRDEDDSTVWLELRYYVAAAGEEDSYGYASYSQAKWLDARKLAELGFDVRPPAIPFGDRFDVAARSRPALVVLEFDGPARAEFLRRLPASIAAHKYEAGTRLHDAQVSDSRLFVVDAGLDAPALRARYPDRRRYAIVPAVVRMDWSLENSRLVLRGSIERLTAKQVHLDASQAAALGVQKRRTGLDHLNDETPRFDVELAFGRRGEPWIVEGRRAPPR